MYFTYQRAGKVVPSAGPGSGSCTASSSVSRIPRCSVYIKIPNVSGDQQFEVLVEYQVRMNPYRDPKNTSNILRKVKVIQLGRW
ncbi:hypothetical protein [Pimelobacter simplex]|uniref:hypothetical protein n=1 Tax=Nocardioides simplex TaxID=2045 RepID=UPI003AAD71E2